MKTTLSVFALILATSAALAAEPDKTTPTPAPAPSADKPAAPAETPAVPAPAETTKPAPRRNPEALFKKLDANTDGSVTKEEWSTSPQAKKNAERAEKSFKARDKDKDDKLTKEEFTAELTRRNKK